MREKKVTTEDLRSLKAGESKTFKVPHQRDIHTARTLASSLGTLEPERGVRFSTSANYLNCTITITAEKR